MKASWFWSVIASCCLLACSSAPSREARVPVVPKVTPDLATTYETANKYPLLAVAQKAADELHEQLKKAVKLPGPLVCATLVNINNLETSSAFGRTITEQISAGLTRNGFQIVEVKYRNGVYVKRSEGELALSREIKELAATSSAQGVVAGTYSVGKDLVFVNLKVIRQNESTVLASYSFALPLDSNIVALLGR